MENWDKENADSLLLNAKQINFITLLIHYAYIITHNYYSASIYNTYNTEHNIYNAYYLENT